MLPPEGVHRILTDIPPKQFRFRKFLPQGTTENHIFKLSIHKDDALLIPSEAFCKFGAIELRGSAAMERLMWKVAKIMGLETNFAQTKKIELLLNDFESLLIGSMQPEVTGALLTNYFEKGDFHLGSVKHSELNHAILASVILGMFDAHEGNIIIDHEWRIIFFDNARCMPNSSGFIKGLGLTNLGSSYRCSLLNLRLRVTRELLEQERKELLDKAKSCLEKVDELRAYLKTGTGKILLEQLPENWINTEAMLEAMLERIGLAIKYLSGSHVNLIGLAFAANPKYTIAYAISFLYELIEIGDHLTRENMINLAHEHHRNISLCSIQTCLEKLKAKNYDLSQVLDICLNTTDDNALIESLIDFHLEVTKGTTTYSYERSQAAEQSLYQFAAVDLKDTRC